MTGIKIKKSLDNFEKLIKGFWNLWEAKMKSEDISSSKASQEKVVTVSNQGIESSMNLKDFESIMTVFMVNFIKFRN